VRDGIEQPVAAYEQRLHEAGGLLQSGSQALAMQLQRMERLHKQLVWKVAGITLGSLVLLLSGGAWLSKHYYDEIRRNQISADLLKAYNQADVTLCGGRLCAKLENGGKQRSEYVLVKSR
ncbi:relaxation protein, partial [Lysobacter sp. 2RAB21]